MNFYTFSLFVFGFPLVSHAVKVNIQGSLSLGKDVMDTISHYMRANNFYNLDSRRVISVSDATTDTISRIVKSAFLCRGLSICQGTLSKFLEDYITTLAKTIEIIFEGFLENELENKIPKGVIFENELKLLLVPIKEILNHADKKLSGEDVDGQSDRGEVFVWTDLIKRINAKFQDRAKIFTGLYMLLDRLEGNPQELNEVKQRLTQKIIIETSLVELEHGHKLCVEERKCIRSFEITKSLKNLLRELQNLPDSKTKQFIKDFYETLSNTNFSYNISEGTSNEFQAILKEMASAESTHTKNVLLAVENTVDDRLNSIKTRTYNSSGRDMKLAHIILSDMDHIYSQHAGAADPFHRFMGKFYEWIESDDSFSSPIQQVMKDIGNKLSLESAELVSKLVNEVSVFGDHGN